MRDSWHLTSQMTWNNQEMIVGMPPYNLILRYFCRKRRPCLTSLFRELLRRRHPGQRHKLRGQISVLHAQFRTIPFSPLQNNNVTLPQLRFWQLRHTALSLILRISFNGAHSN